MGDRNSYDPDIARERLSWTAPVRICVLSGSLLTAVFLVVLALLRSPNRLLLAATGLSIALIALAGDWAIRYGLRGVQHRRNMERAGIHDVGPLHERQARLLRQVGKTDADLGWRGNAIAIVFLWVLLGAVILYGFSEGIDYDEPVVVWFGVLMTALLIATLFLESLKRPPRRTAKAQYKVASAPLDRGQYPKFDAAMELFALAGGELPKHMRARLWSGAGRNALIRFEDKLPTLYLSREMLESFDADELLAVCVHMFARLQFLPGGTRRANRDLRSAGVRFADLEALRLTRDPIALTRAIEKAQDDFQGQWRAWASSFIGNDHPAVVVRSRPFALFTDDDTNVVESSGGRIERVDRLAAIRRHVREAPIIVPELPPL